ncbi:MAG: restriction endonuclease subunit S [Bacteroidetes bacterium]|nr:restriction endonuclease subunit S [Bacteroidota bacterium]
MADLTSLHRNKPKRDFSIQACADCINKIALQFPSEFTKGFFTDYFDIAGGTQPPKSTFINEPREGYVKFLQIRDFSSDSTPTYIPISKNNKLCNEDDLLLGRYGASVGKILSGKSGAYNVACAKIIFLEKEKINKDFLFYWLHSSYFQNFLTSISRSAQGGFNKNDLSRIKTHFPSFAVQRKLTSILKSIDTALLNGDKIEFNKKGKNNIEISFIELVEKFLSFINEGEELSSELTHQLTLVKKLRQQLLQDAVQGKLVEQNKKDEPASELLKRIKAEKVKLITEKKLKKEKELPPIKPEEIPFEIPENWIWCRLGEILSFGPSNGYSPKESKKGTGIKCLTLTATTSGVFREQFYKLVDEQIPKDSYLWLETGDILIQRGNSIDYVGIAALYEGIPNSFIYPDLMIKIRLSKMIDTKFIHQVLVSPFNRKYFSNNAFGAQKSMPKINQVVILNTLIPIPPLSEQTRIVQKLDELMQYCNELQESIKQSESQNEKLLQQVLREALRKKPVEA